MGWAKDLDVKTWEGWRPVMAIQSHTVLLGRDQRSSRSLFLVGPESSLASTTFLFHPTPSSRPSSSPLSSENLLECEAEALVPPAPSPTYLCAFRPKALSFVLSNTCWQAAQSCFLTVFSGGSDLHLPTDRISSVRLEGPQRYDQASFFR